MMRARATVTGVFVILTIASACDNKSAPPPAASAPAAVAPPRNATYAQDSLRDWFIDTGVSDVPTREADILAAFGQPDSIVQLPSASARDPMAFDTIVELHFPGISASVLKVGSDETLQSVWVSDTTQFTGPIRIGTDTASLRALLGPPMLDGELPGYVCGKCRIANESVRFQLVDGKVTAMLFELPGH